MDSLFIIIPAYNEQDTIRKVAEEWYGVIRRHDGGGRSRLVILNDGSRDNTLGILNSMQRDHPLLTVLDKPNSGHGATVRRGYAYALSKEADYIFQTDSDGQTLASEFEPFWAERKNFDLVIGNRIHREDGAGRVFVTKVLRRTLKQFFRVDVTDANTPYRLMSTASMTKILPYVPDDYSLTNVAVTVVYTKMNYRIRYIPITFRPRQGGKNSIHFTNILKIGIQARRDFREIEKKLEKIS
jgi:glycosyltransferase involved in cell wall biosynthesis